MVDDCKSPLKAGSNYPFYVIMEYMTGGLESVPELQVPF